MALIDILEKERNIEKEIIHIDKKIKHQKYICERWSDEIPEETKTRLYKDIDILKNQREKLVESLEKTREKVSKQITNYTEGRY